MRVPERPLKRGSGFAPAVHLPDRANSVQSIAKGAFNAGVPAPATAARRGAFRRRSPEPSFVGGKGERRGNGTPSRVKRPWFGENRDGRSMTSCP